ncbi:MAG TPA: HPF/RaiA family ribosome-associated protein [Bryobacteraceae bacterium]|nr:HPF/RaiA family ribosome-associated protein [Bryobacteraceae bacterium]
MTLAPQITFRNMESSSKMEDAVLKEAARLERFFPRITSCRVAIERPRQEKFGGMYHVRIDVGVPGEKLLVEHNPSQHQTLQSKEAMHQTRQEEPHRELRDPQRAIHEAFHEMRRRLQDYARRIRGDTKQHEAITAGRVTKLFPEEGFGFIDSDGREVYFHRDSVLGGHFDRLRIGSRIRFVEELGEKGPQATTVRLVRSARQGHEAAASVLVPHAKR